MPFTPLDLQIITMRSHEIAGTMGHYYAAEEHNIKEANARNSTESVEMENRIYPTPEEAQEESKILEDGKNKQRQSWTRHSPDDKTQSEDVSENESESHHHPNPVDPELGNIIDVVG